MEKAFIFHFVAALWLPPACLSFVQPTGLPPLHSYGRLITASLANDISKTIDLEPSPLPQKEGGDVSADVVICGGGPAGLLRYDQLPSCHLIVKYRCPHCDSLASFLLLAQSCLPRNSQM